MNDSEAVSKGVVRRFMAYYRPHLRMFVFDMFCALSVALLGLAFPLVTRRIIEESIPNGDMSELFLLGLLLVVIYLAIALFTYFINYYGHMMGVHIEADIRQDLFCHLQKLSFKYYDKNRTGQIMSKTLNDLFDITELAHHGPEDIFISMVMLFGSSIIMFNIEWRLTLCILFFLPIITWFAIMRRKKMKVAFGEVREKIGDVNAQVESSISGIRVVQSFTNEEYEAGKFFAGNSLFKGAKKLSYNAMATFMSGMELLTNLANGMVLIIGGLCIFYDTMQLEDLVVFLLYINIILQPVRRLTNFTQQFEQGMSGFRRFLEVMDTEVEIADSPKAVTLGNVKGDIAFDSVSFSYNEGEDVLNDVDLKIPAGKTVALVGPSGGGKTTICQLIPRFYDCISGNITLDGIDVRDIKLKSLRSAIGIVQQDVFLFAGTIAENIRYGDTTATEAQVIEAAKHAKVHDFIMSCPDGYKTNVGERGIRLSGGQKQRISIARAFLKNPPILILDEATSALDNQTEQLIQQSLNELSKGRTTVVIAHRMSTIKNADTIAVLTDEGVEEMGTHEQLYDKKGLYFSLYNAQFE